MLAMQANPCGSMKRKKTSEGGSCSFADILPATFISLSAANSFPSENVVIETYCHLFCIAQVAEVLHFTSFYI